MPATPNKAEVCASKKHSRLGGSLAQLINGSLLGCDIQKEVQDRLGHSDIQTTMNIYAHVTNEAKEESVIQFKRFMCV